MSGAKRRAPSLGLAALVVGAVVVFAPPSSAGSGQEATPENPSGTPALTERIVVRERSILIDLPRGWKARNAPSRGLIVLEGGIERPARALESLEVDRRRPGPFRLLLYLDDWLVSREARVPILMALAREAASLGRLGSVEVREASCSSDSLRLTPTAEPRRLAEELSRLAGLAAQPPRARRDDDSCTAVPGEPWEEGSARIDRLIQTLGPTCSRGDTCLLLLPVDRRVLPRALVAAGDAPPSEAWLAFDARVRRAEVELATGGWSAIVLTGWEVRSEFREGDPGRHRDAPEPRFTDDSIVRFEVLSTRRHARRWSEAGYRARIDPELEAWRGWVAATAGGLAPDPLELARALESMSRKVRLWYAIEARGDDGGPAAASREPLSFAVLENTSDGRRVRAPAWVAPGRQR